MLSFLDELLAVVPLTDAAVVGGPCLCCHSPVITENTPALYCSLDCMSDSVGSDDDDDDRMDPAWEAWLEYKLDEDYDW
jgi:hypothetical protein